MYRYLPMALLFTFLLTGCSSDKAIPTNSAADPTKPETASAPDWFRDVTAESGIDFTYKNGEEANHFAIIESLGGGVALFDYDNDGLLDIFFPGGGFYEGKIVRGHPCRLYKNLGGMKFKDVTAEVGLTGNWQYSHGAAAFDYDNDGYLDLLVTGYNRLILWHNEPDGKGSRRFVEVTKKAGLNDALWSTSAAWGDLDGDGYADIYVAHYGDWGFDTNNPECTYDGKTRDVCQPRKFKQLPHTIYRNNRDGTFTDITAKLKLRTDGKGIGAILFDANGDGKPDIYVANDTDENFLYINRTKPGGEITLEELGMNASVARDDRATPNGSMGLDIADYDRGGRPSIFVTNYEQELPALYKNRCEGDRITFNYATTSAGIGVIGAIYVSWGTGFADFDHDGWEDLFIANGHAIRFPVAKFGRQQRPVLLKNSSGKFTPITDRGGKYFADKHNARGAALGDLNNDGKTDIVFSHLNEPVVVVQNVSPGGNHWLGIELVGAKHRDIVGAKITVESANGTQHRFVKGGASYGSTNDPRHIIGLGATSTVGKVSVEWPSGAKQVWTDIPVDGYSRLTEGEAKATQRKPAQ